MHTRWLFTYWECNLVFIGIPSAINYSRMCYDGAILMIRLVTSLFLCLSFGNTSHSVLAMHTRITVFLL